MENALIYIGNAIYFVGSVMLGGILAWVIRVFKIEKGD